MKRLKIILVLCLLQQITFGQTNVIEYEHLESLNLKGKVKAINEKSFKATKINSEIVKSGNGWQYDWQNDKEYFFDTFGNLISKKDVLNSKTRDNYSIKLDNKNRIIEINRIYKTTYYQYDSLNRILTSKEVHKQPESISNGNTNPNAGVVTNFKYYYDSKNLLIKKDEFKSNRKISVQTFQYDNFNNLISCEIKEGTYIETHKYQFDSNNLMIKYEWSDNEEGVAEITTFEYLNKVKVLEHWVHYEDGEPDGYIDDKFENGNIIETAEIDIEGTLISNETNDYEFDEKGNWIKMIIDNNGKYYIVERTIEYY